MGWALTDLVRGSLAALLDAQCAIGFEWPHRPHRWCATTNTVRRQRV